MTLSTRSQTRSVYLIWRSESGADKRSSRSCLGHRNQSTRRRRPLARNAPIARKIASQELRRESNNVRICVFFVVSFSSCRFSFRGLISRRPRAWMRSETRALGMRRARGADAKTDECPGRETRRRPPGLRSCVALAGSTVGVDRPLPTANANYHDSLPAIDQLYDRSARMTGAQSEPLDKCVALFQGADPVFTNGMVGIYGQSGRVPLRPSLTPYRPARGNPRSRYRAYLDVVATPAVEACGGGRVLALSRWSGGCSARSSIVSPLPSPQRSRFPRPSVSPRFACRSLTAGGAGDAAVWPMPVSSFDFR